VKPERAAPHSISTTASFTVHPCSVARFDRSYVAYATNPNSPPSINARYQPPFAKLGWMTKMMSPAA
jgi:hypothetical protein